MVVVWDPNQEDAVLCHTRKEFSSSKLAPAWYLLVFYSSWGKLPFAKVDRFARSPNVDDFILIFTPHFSSEDCTCNRAMGIVYLLFFLLLAAGAASQQSLRASEPGRTDVLDMPRINNPEALHCPDKSDQN